MSALYYRVLCRRFHRYLLQLFAADQLVPGVLTVLLATLFADIYEIVIVSDLANCACIRRTHNPEYVNDIVQLFHPAISKPPDLVCLVFLVAAFLTFRSVNKDGWSVVESAVADVAPFPLAALAVFVRFVLGFGARVTAALWAVPCGLRRLLAV